jgi:hypothetical protein
VAYKVWLHISKDGLKGEEKNIKPIRYGPFTILEKIGTNSFHLNIPPYMQIYSVVNIDNLKLYEPPMIIDRQESVSVPSVDEFSPKHFDKLKEDIILDRRKSTSRRGDEEYLRVGLKGTHPSKAWWIEKEKVREQFPHLLVYS